MEIFQKAATFKSFLYLSYKNAQLLFLWTVIFNTFMRQTLTDGCWGLHKNVNCAFPLTLSVNIPQTCVLGYMVASFLLKFIKYIKDLAWQLIFPNCNTVYL